MIHQGPERSGHGSDNEVKYMMKQFHPAHVSCRRRPFDIRTHAYIHSAVWLGVVRSERYGSVAEHTAANRIRVDVTGVICSIDTAVAATSEHKRQIPIVRRVPLGFER